MPDLGPEHQRDAHAGSDSDTSVHKPVDPDPKHVRSVIDGLRGMLGIKDPTYPVIGQKNPGNRDALKEAGMESMNRGIDDGKDASNEY